MLLLKHDIINSHTAQGLKAVMGTQMGRLSGMSRLHAIKAGLYSSCYEEEEIRSQQNVQKFEELLGNASWFGSVAGSAAGGVVTVTIAHLIDAPPLSPSSSLFACSPVGGANRLVKIAWTVNEVQ